MHILDHDAERRAEQMSDISRAGFVLVMLSLAIVAAAAIFVLSVRYG